MTREFRVFSPGENLSGGKVCVIVKSAGCRVKLVSGDKMASPAANEPLFFGSMIVLDRDYSP